MAYTGTLFYVGKDPTYAIFASVPGSGRPTEPKRCSVIVDVVATVGSISPFVGLLGTVVGVINAFTGIASSGSSGIGAIRCIAAPIIV